MSRCCCTSQNRDRDCPIHGDDPPKEWLSSDPMSYKPDELKTLPTIKTSLGWALKRDDGHVRVWLLPDGAVMTEVMSPTGGWVKHQVTADAKDVVHVRDELDVSPEAAKDVVLRCAGCSRTYTGDNDDCPHCGNTDVSEVVKGPE